jgi:hypothetical protein
LSSTPASGADGAARACAAVAAFKVTRPAATGALRLSGASTHGARVSLSSQKAAGQWLCVVRRRRRVGQGAHTSSLSSGVRRHRAAPAAAIALHTTSCCTTKRTALSSVTPAWRPTKEAEGGARRRGRPLVGHRAAASGAVEQLFGRAATPSPNAAGAWQAHWSTCVRAAIARWKELCRRAAECLSCHAGSALQRKRVAEQVVVCLRHGRITPRHGRQRVRVAARRVVRGSCPPSWRASRCSGARERVLRRKRSP